MAPRMFGADVAPGVEGPLVLVSPGLYSEPPNYPETTGIPAEAPVRSLPTATPSRVSFSARGNSRAPEAMPRQPVMSSPFEAAAWQSIFVEPAVVHLGLPDAELSAMGLESMASSELSARWLDEDGSLLAVATESATQRPMTNRSYSNFVGASYGSPAGLVQQRPGTRSMRPVRPTWQPPVPPPGDGACGWSRSSSSRSSSRSSISHDFEVLSNGGSSTESSSHQVSQHEEVANEEPLAQLPVRVWFRTAASVRGRVGSRRPMEALQAPDGSHRHVSMEHQVLGHPLEWSSSWQVADELGHTGGMAAPRYLLVRLGECIPAETGAAPVHLSRLDTGPQWRDFLNYGEGRDPRGCLSLDEMLACPCCVSIYRQPISLPCGHSLCRSCFARITQQPAHMRRCPLCRADFPQCDLKVNLALAAVCDSLRAFRALQLATRGSPVFRLNDDGLRYNGLVEDAVTSGRGDQLSVSVGE